MFAESRIFSMYTHNKLATTDNWYMGLFLKT